MNDSSAHMERSRRSFGRRLLKPRHDRGCFAELDQLLEVRERLVVILDSLDQDDPDTARFYAAGLLDDFDAEVRL